jgi:hypothetical protein
MLVLVNLPKLSLNLVRLVVGFHQKRIQEWLGTGEPALLGLVNLVEPFQTAPVPFVVPAE